MGWLSGWQYRKNHVINPSLKKGKRFYLPSSGAAAVSPAFSSEWEKTSEADRLKCDIVPTNTSMTSKTSSENVATSPYDFLTRQYVSDPIKAQTISGKVKGQIRVMESNTAADFCRAIVIKVVSGDGQTLRGILLSHFPASLTSEYATALTNRYFPPELDLNPVDAQEGDRIVFEIGTRSFNTSTTNRTATHSFGDNAANDLPENETETSAFNPWIEFSQEIEFLSSSLTNYQVKIKVGYRTILQPLTTNLSAFFGSDVDSNGVIFAGDGNYGVYKSTDNGATFTKIFDIPPASNPYYPNLAGKVWTVFVDSRDYIFVSAWCTNKLYRSTNGGSSFSLVLSLPNHSYEDGFLIGMTEDANGNLYAAEYSGVDALARVWKSTDGGANWNVVKTFTALHMHNIKFNPYNGWLYASTGDNGGVYSEADRVFRSKDGGQNWQKVVEYSEGQTRFLAMAFIGNAVFLGGDYGGTGASDIWKFTDDGQSEPFTPTKVWDNTAYADSFFSCAKLDNVLYFAMGGMSTTSSGVVVKGINNGADWIVVKSGTAGIHFNILTAHPERNGIILGCINTGDTYFITNKNSNDSCVAKCRTDFGDIRFTDDDGSTLLDYWMEEKVDGDYAVFWVEVADDLSSNSATIYVYYGRSDVSTTSDGDAAFLFFDHFTILDTTNKWYVESGTWEVSNSLLRQSNTGDYSARLRSKTFTAADAAVRTRMLAVSGEGQMEVEFRGTTGLRNVAGTRFYMHTTDPGGNEDAIYKADGTTWTRLAQKTPWSDGWNTWEIRFIGSSLSLYKNDASWLSTTDTSYTNGYIALHTRGATYKFDWIAVRKYVSPEPSHGSWGSEEIEAILKEVADNIGLSDSTLRNKTFTVTDSVGLAETPLKHWSSQIIDAVNLSESLLRNKTFTIADVIGLTEFVEALKGVIIKYVEDAAGLTDTVKVDKTFVIQEALSLVDQVFRHKPQVPIRDAIVLAEVIYVSKLFTVADTINLLDIALALKQLRISDAISLIDQASTPTRVLQALDAVGLSDNAFVNKTLIITDQMALVEVVEIGVGGVKKTKLFLVLGNLAIQLSKD